VSPLSESDKLAISGLVQVAKWISVIIMTATTLAATVCALRITKQVDFTVGQVKLKITAFPYIVAALTMAHLFLTWGFVQDPAAFIGTNLQYLWLPPNGRTFVRNPSPSTAVKSHRSTSRGASSDSGLV
jgi:hypothetical protein